MEKEYPIGVLTYNVKHRKTYDTLCLLKAKGYQNIKVYAVPYHYEKAYHPLFTHRPEINMDYPDLKDLCQAFRYELVENLYGGGK